MLRPAATMATSIATAAAMATNALTRDSDNKETKPDAVSKDSKAGDKPSWAAVRDSPLGTSSWSAVRDTLKDPITVARARATGQSGGKKKTSVQAPALMKKFAEGDVDTSGLDGEFDSRSIKRVQPTMLNPMQKDANGKDQVPKKDLYQIVAAILAATKRRRGEDSGGVGLASSPDKSDKRDEKEDEDNKKALKEAKSALRTGAASPHEWTGPDTPLRGFTIARKKEFVKVLLQVKADPNEADKNGVSVLHFAAFDNNPEMCRTLLAGKADVNVRDKHGQTPMFFTPNEKVCEVLSQFRADLTLTNLQGQTALHLAGRAGLADVLLWFMSRVTKAILVAHDQHGANALYYARNSGVKESVIRTIRNHTGTTAVSRIVASETNFQDNSQLHRAGATSDKSDAENSQFDEELDDEDEPKDQTEVQRTEKYKALAAAADKERAIKQAIREVDVDSALVKIANSARDKGVRVKDYFKQWDFLIDKRIKRENLRVSLQQLGPDIDSQEFKAILYLLDPSCTDFVLILELDDAIRTAVKRHMFLDAREKSRQNWAEKRGRFGEKTTHNLSGGKGKSGSPKKEVEDDVDNLSGYASSEPDDFKTKHHWKDTEYGKKGNTLEKAAVIAPAHARVVAAREKAQARSREWTKRKERGENFGYGVKKPALDEEEQRPPESPVKMARDDANRNERQASAILRQKQIAERRDYLLKLKEQQQLMVTAGVDVQKAQIEGSWALAKTLRVQMSIADVARSKEKEAAEAQKRVRKMMRSSINVEIGALNDAHDDKQRARRADKEAEKAAEEERTEKTAAEVADMAAEAARQAILDLEAKAKMAAMISKADEVQEALVKATAQEAFFCWRDEWKEVKAEKARVQAEAEAIEAERLAAEQAAEAQRLAEIAAAEALAAKEAAAEVARQAARRAAGELVAAKNALTDNDDGCAMFAPADWCEGGRIRMCKNCGDPWTQHKGIIKQEEVDSCQEETLKDDLAEAEETLAKRQEELAAAERNLQLSAAEDAAQAAAAQAAEPAAEAPEAPGSAAAADGEAAPAALEVVDKAEDNDKAAAVEPDKEAAVQPDKEAAVQPAPAAAVEPASEAAVQPDNEAEAQPEDYDNEAGIKPDDEAAGQPVDVEGDTF